MVRWWQVAVVGLAGCGGGPSARVGTPREPVSVPREAPALPVPSAMPDRVLRVGRAVSYGDATAAPVGVAVPADVLVARTDAHAALFDHDPATAYCAPWTSDGVRLSFALSAPLVGVVLLGGDFSSVDALVAHGRVAVVRVEALDVRPTVWELVDPLWSIAGDERPVRLLEQQRAGPAWLALPTPVTAPVVDLVIPSVFGGKSGDVCIAELELRVAG